ncbi:hypothetical protein Ancab_007736 [Ancistrocladus abbreviatus]
MEELILVRGGLPMVAMQERLLVTITESEVKVGFFYFEDLSALVPDGHSSSFFKAIWPMISAKLVPTIITVIPKSLSTSSMGDYHLIAFYSIMYKAIAKIDAETWIGHEASYMATVALLGYAYAKREVQGGL